MGPLLWVKHAQGLGIRVRDGGEMSTLVMRNFARRPSFEDGKKLWREKELKTKEKRFSFYFSTCFGGLWLGLFNLELIEPFGGLDNILFSLV